MSKVLLTTRPVVPSLYPSLYIQKNNVVYVQK
jgi:hypothetical protein